MANTLTTTGKIIFATPVWADGKNENDSIVRALVKVSTSDDHSATGYGAFENGTEISTGGLREMGLAFDATEAKSIIMDNVTKIEVKLSWFKPDADNYRSDEWTFRMQTLLDFSSGLKLCTYPLDPPDKFYFKQLQDDRFYPAFTQFEYNQTLFAGCN